VLLARATPPERRVLRLFGVSESAVGRALEEAGGDGDGVEATICAREFEIHVDLVAEPGAAARADELAKRLAAPLHEYLFARDGKEPVEALVLRECRTRGLTLSTAESCTGGLVAARLTSVPGSSDVFRGSVVSYANEVKVAELGVPPATLEAFGAVSAETAEAMAHGVRARLGTDVGVAVTGIAGPDGGTPEKPVGLVYLHASGPDGDLAASFGLPGDRETVRARAAASALHLVRRLVTKS
jgi:nicotinamide-nucleotide amidase